jgi:membrane protein
MIQDLPFREQARSESQAPSVWLGLATAWDVLSSAFLSFRFHGGVNLAAAIAFYATLSIIPLITLTVLVLGFVFGSNPAIQSDVVRIIQSVHPQFPAQFLAELTRIDTKEFVLGWVGVFSLIWASSLIFNSIEMSFSIIFQAPIRRKYLVSKLLALTMIPLGWAVAALSIAVTYIPDLIRKSPLFVWDIGFFQDLFIGLILQRLVPFVLVVGFFTIVYKVVPTTLVRWRQALTAGVLFSVLMVLARFLFVTYMPHGQRTHLIYGPLETVVALVLWIFYISIVLLFCAELIVSYQKRDVILLEKAFLKAS